MADAALLNSDNVSTLATCARVSFAASRAASAAVLAFDAKSTVRIAPTTDASYQYEPETYQVLARPTNKADLVPSIAHNTNGFHL